VTPARRSLEGLALGDAFGERWFPIFREPRRAADLLGNGQRIRADDTTCAITGGIVAARTGLDGVPRDWLRRREPLPGPGVQTD